MGAAAFLMVEYVGIPYSEIVKHALLPAVFSYIALLYIVHLEAIKIGSKTIPRRPDAGAGAAAADGPRPGGQRHRRLPRSITASSASRPPSAVRRPGCSRIAGIALYVASIWYSSRYPGSGDRRSERADPGTAARLGRDPHRARLPDPDRRAALVPDGRADVAGPVGVLGDGCRSSASSHPQAADGAVPQRRTSPPPCAPRSTI